MKAYEGFSDLEKRVFRLERIEEMRTLHGAELLMAALKGLHITAENEAVLQSAVRERFHDLRVTVQEQVALTKGCRPDFFLPVKPDEFCGVAVELKTKGGLPDLLRQLDRYAVLDAVDAILVVTTRRQHSRVPADLRGKPISYLWVGVV